VDKANIILYHAAGYNIMALDAGAATFQP